MPDSTVSQDRPLSFFGALGWVSFSLLLLFVTFGVSQSIRPGLASDLVNANVCAALAFSCAAYGVVRLHLPARELDDALALRPLGWLVYPLALAAGFGTLVAASWVSGWVDHRWPLPASELQSLQEAYTLRGPMHRVAFAFATIALGPVAEELLFRGALFQALRRTYRPGTTVLLTALLFAFCHVSLRHIVHVLPAGLVLGALRASTGSLFAPLLAHMAFNAITAFQLLAGRVSLTEPEPLVPWWQGLTAVAGTVMVLGLVQIFGRPKESLNVDASGNEL